MQRKNLSFMITLCSGQHLYAFASEGTENSNVVASPHASIFFACVVVLKMFNWLLKKLYLAQEALFADCFLRLFLIMELWSLVTESLSQRGITVDLNYCLLLVTILHPLHFLFQKCSSSLVLVCAVYCHTWFLCRFKNEPQTC